MANAFVVSNKACMHYRHITQEPFPRTEQYTESGCHWRWGNGWVRTLEMWKTDILYDLNPEGSTLLFSSCPCVYAFVLVSFLFYFTFPKLIMLTFLRQDLNVLCRLLLHWALYAPISSMYWDLYINAFDSYTLQLKFHMQSLEI